MWKRLISRILSSGNRDAIVATVDHKSVSYNGRALVSYIKKAVESGNKESFLYHSNNWECFEIVGILSRMGFDVDVIDHDNYDFCTDDTYDVFIDIHKNLQRLAPFVGRKCKNLLHMTGSYPFYSVRKELERVYAMEARRGVLYSPKRIVDCGYFEKSLNLADACSLLGNRHTLSTYPEKYHSKVTLIPPTASVINPDLLHAVEVSGKKKNFLWYYGFGAVHKGLDLLLEIFSARPELTLHIVGNVSAEKDFLQIYRKELVDTGNIRMHGYLSPSSSKFADIISTCACFIGPSCSESTSVASATCLQLGLFPIISVDNGIDLPEDCGITLIDCSIDEISQAIDHFLALSDTSIEEQAEACMAYARKEFSREVFHVRMVNYLNSVLG